MDDRVPAPPRPRGGRPSKGPRRTYAPYLEPELATLLQHDAYRRGMAVIELTEALIAREFGHQVLLPAPVREVDPERVGAPPVRTAIKLRLHIADRVVAEAQARDITYSAYIAHLLRRAYDRPSQVPEPIRPVPRQEELVMGA